jgi:hypothetical protein
MLLNGNLILRTDSFNFTHWKQYPPGIERVYSLCDGTILRDGTFSEVRQRARTWA